MRNFLFIRVLQIKLLWKIKLMVGWTTKIKLKKVCHKWKLSLLAFVPYALVCVCSRCLRLVFGSYPFCSLKIFFPFGISSFVTFFRNCPRQNKHLKKASVNIIIALKKCWNVNLYLRHHFVSLITPVWTDQKRYEYNYIIRTHQFING